MALTLLISIILLALCLAGMAISLLVKKDGRFPDTEIGSNPRMRQLGLRCAKEEECSSCSAASPIPPIPKVYDSNRRSSKCR